MKSPHALLFLLLSACGEGGDLGGQSGTVSPPTCVELSRQPVEDPAVLPVGFTATLDGALASVEGPWEGMFEGEVVQMRLSRASAATAVVNAFDDGPSDPLQGAPSTGCGPVYELDLQLELTAGPLLDVLVVESTTVGEGGEVSWLVRVPDTDVGGTLVPPYDPTDWEHNELGIEFTTGSMAPHLTLIWYGFDDDAAESTAEVVGSIELAPGSP